MKTPLLGIAAALLLCTGCDKDTATSASEATAPDEKIESTNDLAEPAEIPAGFESLSLTKGQAAKINQWLVQQGEQADPSDLAAYVTSLLRDDQQAEFRKVIEAAGG